MSGGPENTMRKVVEECADCDICRFLMDASCLMFPELYRLRDREMETGEPIPARDLCRLADLCNFCALCPCPPVRSRILQAKAETIAREGLQRRTRLMEDVALVAKLCGAWPRLAGKIVNSNGPGGMIRRVLGIHRDRRMPSFARPNFFSWAKSQSLDRPNESRQGPKVAYFAGCTAGHLFPNVARAAVALLRATGVRVWVPPQNCCGMPALLEGDRGMAQSMVGKNIRRLSRAVADGYDIVCSCPTCGYVLREMLREGACYSEDCRRSVDAPANAMKMAAVNGHRQHQRVHKSVYGNQLADDGVFSGIDAVRRIAVAEHTFDLGQYLLKRVEAKESCIDLAPLDKRLVYYPPCHLREQKIGRPYVDLLAGIPSTSIETFAADLYCCGMAGIMGFKKDFHKGSIEMGSPLMEKIHSLRPEILVTDCLSCRLQFNQMSDLPVLHPLEVLQKAQRSQATQ